jgi:DNA invertase Pin-like site-specific DNA recombinase
VEFGDTVLVHSLDRLARNLDDLRLIVRRLTAKKVPVEFVKEQLSFCTAFTDRSTLTNHNSDSH